MDLPIGPMVGGTVHTIIRQWTQLAVTDQSHDSSFEAALVFEEEDDGP